MVGAIMMEILYVLSVIMIRVSGVAIRNNNRNPRRYGGDFFIHNMPRRGRLSIPPFERANVKIVMESYFFFAF